MKALLLALFFCVSAHSVPNERSGLHEALSPGSAPATIMNPESKDILVACDKPQDLIAAANALLRRYFKTDMYNSALFDKFLWLHPEHEDFIACVICRSGKPHDPYWERDFIRMCNERSDSLYLVNETTEDTSFL